MNAYTSSLI